MMEPIGDLLWVTNESIKPKRIECRKMMETKINALSINALKTDLKFI